MAVRASGYERVRSDELAVVPGGALVVLTMTVVVLPSIAIWAAAGTALHRLASHPRGERAVGAVLAVLLAGSIAFIRI